MKLEKISFQPIPAIIGLSVAALVGWGVSSWTDFPFWGAFAIMMVAMIVNGVIAQHEDEAPGGLNNPFPHQTEKHKETK